MPQCSNNQKYFLAGTRVMKTFYPLVNSLVPGARIMRDAGMQILDDAMTMATAAGVGADTVPVDHPGGRLAEAAAEAARPWKADLVVVGTHGRRGVGRMLLGSGAEQLIRRAPVLVIRSETENQPAAH